MELNENDKRACIVKLLQSRMRILETNGFYGLLLMHMEFTLDETIGTAATDGNRIYFDPKFLLNLDEDELDFVLMHEILHVALQHCLRQGERDNFLFNVACDIVVNSNILLSNDMNLHSISVRPNGPCMHLTPTEQEGNLFTAEEVYEMFPKHSGKGGSKKHPTSTPTQQDNEQQSDESWDNHTRWGTKDDDGRLSDIWKKRVVDAYEAVASRRKGKQCGTIPLCIERIYTELKNPQTDWRTILNDFVQEDVVDYSFNPPDKRFADSPFFLPDFNEKDESVENILFMIDTSGSMTDEMVTAAYSEVKGAIDQFDGKLKGWLGFFDAAVVEPQAFENEEEFKIIKAAGGGGTSFEVIFQYVRDHMQDQPPVSIIILSDGYAPFPDEAVACGIPVLWLLNNKDVTPPWGKIARIKV